MCKLTIAEIIYWLFNLYSQSVCFPICTSSCKSLYLDLHRRFHTVGKPIWVVNLRDLGYITPFCFTRYIKLSGSASMCSYCTWFKLWNDDSKINIEKHEWEPAGLRLWSSSLPCTHSRSLYEPELQNRGKLTWNTVNQQIFKTRLTLKNVVNFKVK